MRSVDAPDERDAERPRFLETEEWPRGELEVVATCPVCGSSARTKLYKGLKDRVYYCAPGSWSFYRCLACGTAYLDPRPTPASTWRAYANYCTHKPMLDDDSDDARSVKRWLRRALRNGYINHRYGSSLSPALSIGAWVVYFLSKKRSQIDLSMRYLPFRGGGISKVLDIGCGNGAFLKMARHLGWESEGIDTDSKAVAHGAPLGAKLGGFPSIEFPEKSFDAVTLSHVIEHVHDPLGAMREVLRLLKPGGQVTVITPNLDGLGHRYFGANWIGLHPPAHMVLFTISSMTNVLQRAGFTNLRLRHVYGQFRDNLELSMRIERHIRPFIESPLRPSLSLSALACLGDMVAKINPRFRENIVVTANRSL